MEFVELIPESTHAAFEFLHASWFADEVFGILRGRNLALCVADSEQMSTPLEVTADYGCFRLRDQGYQPTYIERWGKTIRELRTVSDVFVYFKHEEQGPGDRCAAQ